jgi:hypothetical protein
VLRSVARAKRQRDVAQLPRLVASRHGPHRDLSVLAIARDCVFSIFLQDLRSASVIFRTFLVNRRSKISKHLATCVVEVWWPRRGIELEAMFSGPICGASMNPARSLGPALISGHLQHVWIYLLAPVVDAWFAALCCRCVRGSGCCWVTLRVGAKLCSLPASHANDASVDTPRRSIERLNFSPADAS